MITTVDDGILPRCILLIILIIASGFFSGSETALVYSNKIRLLQRADNGDKSSQRVLYILEHFDKALSTILLGNNVINVLAASVGAVLAIQLIGPAGSVVSTIVLTLLIFFFSETIPKNIANLNSDLFAQKISLPLLVMMTIFAPVVGALSLIGHWVKKPFSSSDKAPTLTEEEFQSIIEIIEEEGILDAQESELIKSAIKFGDIYAQDVMTEKAKVVYIDVNQNNREIKRVLLAEKFSRIPVCNGDLDHVVGIAQTRDCLRKLIYEEKFDLHTSISSSCFVPPDMGIDCLFEELCRRRLHIAIVRNDRGQTLGIVTMDDILEELVGDLFDEDDFAPEINDQIRCER